MVLRGRGVSPRPKPKGSFHIVYASAHNDFWDAHHIPPELSMFGEVSTFYFADHGWDLSLKGLLSQRGGLNLRFLDFIRSLHRRSPIDLILTYFSGREIFVKTIEAIKSLGIIICTFHLDDRFSFRGNLEQGTWSGPVQVARNYDLNMTHAPESLVKYQAIGALALLWPLAASPRLCKPMDVPFRYDVAFVGSPHGRRPYFIRELRRRGIPVEVFGPGWPRGRIENSRINEVFCSSKINLSFGDIGYSQYQCGKARDFEVPMCGALLLASHNPHLSAYYELDKEIFTFGAIDDCAAKIRWILENPHMAEEARIRARARSLREHTWERRISTLLETLGLLPPITVPPGTD